MIKGYKVFDSNFCCRGYQYEIGKTYTHTGKIEPCVSGFHFCEKLVDCYEYYPFDKNNKIAEIIAHGETKKKGDKSVTNIIEIVREITWDECLKIVNHGIDNNGRGNTGDLNTGNWNTGNWNTGDLNTGDLNTGNWNTGDWNTGNWNTGDLNTGNWNTGDLNTGDLNTGDWNTGDLNKTDFSSGVLCTKESKILIFDKKSDMTISDWRNSKFAKLFFSFRLCEWVNEIEMTDQEKIDHPKFYVQSGYLKTYTPEEAWQNWFKSKSPDEIELVKQIPNFSYNKFQFITGIDLRGAK